MEEVPDFGAVFTFGKSKFGDNNANKFWVKSDPVTAVACGDEHTAVVTKTGRVYTFGSNQWGQLALGHTNQTKKPSFVKSLKGTVLTRVACGRTHTLLASKDNVYACGGNGEHQVNDTRDDEVIRPYLIPSLSGIQVKALSCGVEHSVVLSADGDCYLWGTGSEGQLGMGPNVTELLKPTILQFTDEKIRDASCGYYHTGIVTQSGKVFTFGESESGKLGVGEECQESYSVPQPVFLVESAVGIACGNSCTAVRASNGHLYMTGDGQRGQLGFSPKSINKCVYTLTKVPCPPISYVAVGEGHTAVLTHTGYLYTFGDGRHGKLCHGEDNIANLFTPYLVETFSAIATVESVACGGCHTMVVARPGRAPDQSRDSRHKRLNKHSVDRLDSNLKLHNNIPNITIESQNVKSLESALGEKDVPRSKIVQLDKSYDKNQSRDKSRDKSRDQEKKEKRREEASSGSETDAPGTTSDVTDSETEDTATEGNNNMFMENLMSIEELEPVSHVTSSQPIRAQDTGPVTSPVSSVIKVRDKGARDKAADKQLADQPNRLPERSLPIVVDKSVVQSLPEKSRDLLSANQSTGYRSRDLLKTTVQEEASETDEEGEYTDESEEEEEVEKTKEIVKTLVSEVPAESPAKQQAAVERSKKDVPKTPSKFKFWKKTSKEKKEEAAPAPATPGNQHNSKACIIL